MNDNEKDRIAAAINHLRPDWPKRSLRTLLDNPKLSSRSRRDAAIALTWVACESQTVTPARVLEAGPWWATTNTDASNTGARHPTREEACADCGRRERDHVGEWMGDHPFTPTRLAKARRTPAPANLRETR